MKTCKLHGVTLENVRRLKGNLFIGNNIALTGFGSCDAVMESARLLAGIQKHLDAVRS